MNPTVAIVGAGRLGTALGMLLKQRGYPIAGVVCRSLERARKAVECIGDGTPHTDPAKGAKGAQLVFLTVPDQVLGDVVDRVAAGRRFRQGDVLIHTSGALSADVLRVKGIGKAGCLSMHPIQTIADSRSGAERLVGAAYGLEGDEEAVALGKGVVQALGGVPLLIAPGAKAFYHAAACVGSNYLVTLIETSLRLYQLAGIPRKAALSALAPLLEGTVANAARLGIPWALTGPIDRGDVDTIRRHLETLGSIADEGERQRLDGLYRVLGLHTLRLVEEKEGALSLSHRGIRDLLQGVYEQ